MFEFKGEITGQGKEYLYSLHKKTTKVMAITYISMAAVVLIVASICMRIWWGPLCGVLFIPLFWLVKLNPTKGQYALIAPSRIVINEDTISFENKKTHMLQYLESVDSVIDFEEFYLFKFTERRPINEAYICQKDLIVNGTIEEFESVFADKIVKNNDVK